MRPGVRIAETHRRDVPDADRRAIPAEDEDEANDMVDGFEGDMAVRNFSRGYARNVCPTDLSCAFLVVCAIL